MNQAPTQTEMPLFQVAADDPNVEWLEKYLKQMGDWTTARAVAVFLGRTEQSDFNRQVRAWANASDWVISGQKGYKHLEQATAEEIRHFINWMESQGKKMISRAERMRRNAHKQLG